MFDDFTSGVLKSIPIAFDYAAGTQPRVDRIVGRLISEGFTVFVHFWPESDLGAVPLIKREAVKGWSHDGIGFRLSDPDSFCLMDGFHRRVAINLKDTDVGNQTHYENLDKVLCGTIELVRQLRAHDIPAEILTYDTVLRTLVELLPQWAADIAGSERSVSVVIPTADRPNHLERTVQAIRRQKLFPDVEILVVDNGQSPQSSSANAQVCARFDARYIEDRAPTGIDVGRAKNIGLAAASGTYLMVLDDDTVISPWHVLSSIRLIMASGGSVAVAPRHLSQSDFGFDPLQSEVSTGPAVPVPYGSDDGNAPEIERLDEICDGNLLFHRSLFDNGVRFEERLSWNMEDRELHCRIRDLGIRFRRLSSSSCTHLSHARPPFDIPAFLAAEQRFLFLHPHMCIDAQFRAALSPFDGGLVSVIAATNGGTADEQERFLTALVAQKYAGDIEFIVCDVSDTPSHTLRDLSKQLGATYVPDSPCPKVASSRSSIRSRNAGIASSSGEYLLFVDQDTLLAPHYVQNCVNLLSYQYDFMALQGERQTQARLMSMGAADEIGAATLTTERALQLLARVKCAASLPVKNINDDTRWTQCHNLFVARWAIEATGTLDDLFAGSGQEELDFTYRLYKAGIRFARLDTLPSFHVPCQPAVVREELRANDVLRFARKHPETREDRCNELEWAIDTLNTYFLREGSLPAGQSK